MTTESLNLCTCTGDVLYRGSMRLCTRCEKPCILTSTISGDSLIDKLEDESAKIMDSIPNKDSAYRLGSAAMRSWFLRALKITKEHQSSDGGTGGVTTFNWSDFKPATGHPPKLEPREWANSSEISVFGDKRSQFTIYIENRIKYLDDYGYSLTAREKEEAELAWEASIREPVSVAPSAAPLSEPTEAMCDNARGFILGLDLGIRTFGPMQRHLDAGGYKGTPYIRAHAEHWPTAHITKWDVAHCIWQLMAALHSPSQQEKNNA